jgi:AcrR family transcriptional regulator
LKEPTEKQQRILEAAVEVFAERGFAGASTNEIAKRAGVAEGTIFKHYKTKKDLLIGVVAPFFFRFVIPGQIDEVVSIMQAPHPTFEAFLRALYTNRLEFVLAHRRAVRVALQELPFHEEVRALAHETIVTRVWPHARAVIERFQASGHVRAADPASVMRICVTAMLGYVAVRVVAAPDRAWDDDREIDLMASTLARGLAP